MLLNRIGLLDILLVLLLYYVLLFKNLIQFVILLLFGYGFDWCLMFSIMR